MDPLTHAAIGALGATLVYPLIRRRWLKPTRATPRPYFRRFLVAGALAGMSPDLDLVAQFITDPIWALGFHRGPTHGIFMAPLGGLIVAFGLWLALKLARRQPWPWAPLWGSTTVGYALHPVFDWVTTSGVQILWPLTNTMYSLGWVGVVDPLHSLPLGVLMAIAWLTRQPRWAYGALAWVLLVQASYGYTHHRVGQISTALITQRGATLTHTDALGQRSPLWYPYGTWQRLSASADTVWVDDFHALPWGPITHTQSFTVPRVTEADLGLLNGHPLGEKLLHLVHRIGPGFVSPLQGDPHTLGHYLYGARTRAGCVQPVVWLRFEPTTAQYQLYVGRPPAPCV